MRVMGMALAIVLGLTAVARSEPVELKRVAADAKWVMHVDVDALRASVVVQNAYKKCLEKHKDAEKHLDKLRDKIGMDLRKDLHGVTLYGKDTDKHHAVAIVHAQVNQKLLLEKAAKAPDHKVTKYGSYELHSWTQKDKKGTHPVTGAFYKPDVMVFAGCVDGVKAALDVLSGKAAGIGSDSPLAGRLRPGTILLARASVINPKTRCPLLKQAESFRVALGENNGESFYRARVVMKTTEAVEQVKTIAEGLRAIVALRHGSDAEAMKLLKGLSVTSEGKTLNIRWSASANDVWAAAEKCLKKLAERKAKCGCPVRGPACKGCPMCRAKPKAERPKAKRAPLLEDEF